MQLQAKITMLSVVIGFCMIWSLLFPCSLYGYESQATSWVIDEQNVLDHAVNKRITHVLKESAFSRNIYVKVFILHQPTQESITNLANEAVLKWEKSHFDKTKKPMAYLIVNSVTNKSDIILGAHVSKEFSLLEGIRHIKEDILNPSLEINDINKAVWEGAVALSMVLENWPQTLSMQQHVKLWLANNHLSFLPQCLKWIFYLAMVAGLGVGLKKYFQPPPAQMMKKVNCPLEDAIRASDIAYWREAQERATELETQQ